MTDQGTHFINDAIKYFTDHFILKHTSSIIYYPQGNGQPKYTNKVFGTLLIKLINENRNDLDQHLSIVLFSYRIAYKVGTSHTPFQLVYGLHPLLPTKYMLPFKPGETKDPQLVRVLISQLFKLEKLQANRLITHDLITSNQWNKSLWSQNWFIETKFQFGDYVLWFPGVISKHALKFQR